jgi:hypothetical protein
MPAKANVFINFGPYKSNGIVEHRTDRLDGLKSKIYSCNSCNLFENVFICLSIFGI